MTASPTFRAARLVDGQVEPPRIVPALSIRDLPPDRLIAIERTWMPERERIAPSLAAAGAGGEHGHWDWRLKIGSASSGRHRLIALECRGDVQGLMAVLVASRPARLGPAPDPILYIDYLETAPWNLKGPSARPRFLGVGKALILEAIAISLEAGWRGRLGLHSLPQAEGFYGSACRMTPLGRDPGYYNLTYFEYTESQASKWLEEVGGRP